MKMDNTKSSHCSRAFKKPKLQKSDVRVPGKEEPIFIDMSSCLRSCLEYSVHINRIKKRTESTKIQRDQKY